ncbi:uncharacterized protein LOC115875430 [Sitophilus oryzae]|uniref:Uncharacterized protein LOC115875430 n=1 Tax=Sitophilus oryzae TaxID=7048 RepID=A0A6J2X6E9_SITOR|nr:uncharacterized protein LOC115875430 [Sitophilus oryzae]
MSAFTISSSVLFLTTFTFVQIDSGQFPGYFYPESPNPPFHFDEPSTSPPIYVPPVFSDEPPQVITSDPPSQDYLPPKPTTSYLPPPSNEIFPPLLPPTLHDDDSVVIPAFPSPSNSPKPDYGQPAFQIQSMSCIQGSSFRVDFKTDGLIPWYPVIEESNEECVETRRKNVFRINLNNFEAMLRCGVKRCSKDNLNDGGRDDGINFNMCATIRVPTVRGVRLPEDKIITLMCTPQDRVVSKTRHIKLGTNKILSNIHGRSNQNIIASGGSQNDLKTLISIFKRPPGSNTFDQTVQPNSVIDLGEELLLRAVVNDEDGWKSSQLGSLVATGLQSKKSVILLDENGCVNSMMRSICPKKPQKVSPLTTELYFRAFLFQESPQGDEIVLSLKMHGCLNPRDCSKSDICQEKTSGRTKTKRATVKLYEQIHENLQKNASNEIEDWESELVFRVQPPIVNRKTIQTSKSSILYDFGTNIILVGVCLCTLLFVLLTCCLCYKKKYA